MKTKSYIPILCGLTAVFFLRIVLLLPQTLVFDNEPVFSEHWLPLLTAAAFALVLSVFLAACLSKQIASGNRQYLYFTLFLLIDSLLFGSLSDFLCLSALGLAVIVVLLRNRMVLCAALSVPVAFLIPMLKPSAFFSVIPLIVSVLFLTPPENKNIRHGIFWLRWALPLLCASVGFLFSLFHADLLNPLLPLLPDQASVVLAERKNRAMVLLLFSMIPMFVITNSFFNHTFNRLKSKTKSALLIFYNKAYICMILLYILQVIGVVLYKDETVFCINCAMPFLMLLSGKGQTTLFFDEVEHYRTTKPAVFFAGFVVLLFFYTFLAFLCRPTETIFAMTNTRL